MIEDNIERFKKIFVGLERAHGVTIVGESNGSGTKIKGKSFVKREPVTTELWEKHLQGLDSLGVIPINDDNKCKWGCIDIDSYAGFDHKKLIDKIFNLHLPLVVCRSKSGGAHVFLFTEDYVSASLMQDKLNEIRSVLGYGGSEVFPKQRELKSKDDTGNFLNLPYFNGDNTTRYAFDRMGVAVNLEGFYKLHYENKITPQELEELQIKRPKTPYSDGPPCIELMAQNKVKEGGRDNGLFHYSVYAKSKWPTSWKGKVNVFNESFMDPPLDDASVERIKSQHGKKEWGYKCNDQPMCSLCDKKLCKTREFGIGEEITFPNLTDLQVVNLEEPYYYMNVDGERLYLDSAKHLTNQSLFQEECVKQLRFNPKTLKTNEWKQRTNLLLKNAEITEPAEGTSTKDLLKNYLEDYCLNRIQKDKIDEIKMGGTYTEGGFHYFVFDNFYNKFLLRNHWKVPYQRTSQMLRDNLNCHTKRVTKAKISVFVVPQFDKKDDNYKSKSYVKKHNY
jgi:hypothetical protein